MRGTPIMRAIKTANNGIIPAYAGNTPIASPARIAAWDHPRVCGEHCPCQERGCIRSGSSPRMRGTHAHNACTAGNDGIIPAYAGNTCWHGAYLQSSWDHPRVCGEHALMKLSSQLRMGSSPRMRGTLIQPVLRPPSAGIIPAYAGNTEPCPRKKPTYRDHPRVCGEHFW